MSKISSAYRFLHHFISFKLPILSILAVNDDVLRSRPIRLCRQSSPCDSTSLKGKLYQIYLIYESLKKPDA